MVPRPLALAVRVAAAALAAFAGVACAEGAAPVAVPRSPEEVSPLPVGSRVPAAPLRSVGGGPADLAGLVAEQGALLVFYRGGW